MQRVRVHVYVEGFVQGIGFRYALRQLASRLGLAGWVRNLPDGRVEAVFEGDEAAVRQAVEWCRRGPPGAVVRRVEETLEPPTGAAGGFEIRHTPYW